MIQKSGGDLAVSCKKQESAGGGTFVSKANGGIWGNILAGGIIGYAIDASSGAGFDYPPNLTVIMNPPCPSK
jgi:phosphoketolase